MKPLSPARRGVCPGDAHAVTVMTIAIITLTATATTTRSGIPAPQDWPSARPAPAMLEGGCLAHRGRRLTRASGGYIALGSIGRSCPCAACIASAEDIHAPRMCQPAPHPCRPGPSRRARGRTSPGAVRAPLLPRCEAFTDRPALLGSGRNALLRAFRIARSSHRTGGPKGDGGLGEPG